MTAGGGQRAVIGCMPCASTWEVDAGAVPELDPTCCPDCGGWTFLAEVLEPARLVLESAGAGGGEIR